MVNFRRTWKCGTEGVELGGKETRVVVVLHVSFPAKAKPDLVIEVSFIGVDESLHD